MKTCLKSDIPELLKQYQLDNPYAKWEQFKNECQDGYKDVQKRLREDQRNLCCYCEIDTKYNLGDGKDDFRVEHFHPKGNKKDAIDKNWALDWQNMLGCCHGGTEQYVTDSNNRFISNKNERHSDALKGEFIWDDEILNPLDIPAFPILFKVHFEDGSLSVIENNCRLANIDITKAENCLHPEKLNLNSEKLLGKRKDVLDKLNELLEAQILQGLSIEQATKNLVRITLEKNKDGYYRNFFTSIRSYFGKDAENYLTSINYQG